MPKKQKIVKKDPYDTTSSKRQVTYLQKLTDEGGKRLSTDFSADDLHRLNALQEAQFGSTTAEVIRNAIRLAHQSLTKKGKSSP